MTRLFCAIVALSVVLGTWGCAEERAPISRVQPNWLAKSFFVGHLTDPEDDPEFYMRTTLVDVAAGAGADGLFTSSDAQPTTRVRWEITENLLVARLTYELLDNTDGKGVRRTPDGQLVAAYTISSHFDIQRDYNPATGEEGNVIVENSSDRAWNEREFFRIDWSRNLVTDAYDLDALSQLGVYYGVKWDPVAYYVNDPESPDAPTFDFERGYLDVTNKAYAAPEVIHDEEWGDYPACWLIGYWPLLSCNPSEVTLRQSFLKIVDTDYEPLAIDGTMMDMFGYFTLDRFGYDRRYGIVDDQWRRFAARWNLFERSHVDPIVECNTPETTPVAADPHRDENGDGTEDECDSVGGGSRCDDIVGECTIPLMQRRVKTIPWHVNVDSPPDLFDGSARALGAWNQAMRVAVLAGRLAECRRTGGAECESKLGWPTPWSDDFVPPKPESATDDDPAKVPDIFVLCHNPVDPEAGDAEACGPAGTSPRLGDLRYNMLNIIPGVQLQAPWGIMVDAEDPLTGEKIAGSANEWAYVLDRASSNVSDIVALMNGEIPAEEFLSGENVSDWVDANEGTAGERLRPMKPQEIESRRRAFDPEALAAFYAAAPKDSQTAKTRIPPAVRHQNRVKALGDNGFLGTGNADLSARLRKLKGTQVEAMLASPEMRQAVGFDPTSPPSADQITRASPFGRMNPTNRRAEERSRRLYHADRHGCHFDGLEPDYLVGLAKRVNAMFPSPDPADAAAVLEHRQRVYDWVRQETSMGVLAHELGHSMGLRHNFAASFDSLNYKNQYWQLRTKNGSVDTDCAEGETDGAACIGPRWKDPITDAELEGDIGLYATTSVMDYPGDQNQDMTLPGRYDRAALRFGYGGVVDVWAADGVSVEGSGAKQAQAYELTSFTVSAGLFGIQYFNPVNPDDPYVFKHYSTYQRDFGLLGTCESSSDADAVDGQKCTGAPMDVVDYRDMNDFAAIPDLASFNWANAPKAVDPSGRVRRGYMFSSDEYADSGNVPTFTDDAGADPYEQIRFLESSYENRYIFDAFRRNRVQFNSWDTTARIQAKYLDTVQMIAKAFAFGAVLDGNPTSLSDGFLDDGYYGPLAMGSSVAFDLYARIMTRGEPGFYCPAEFCGGVQPIGVGTDVYTADSAPLPEVYLYDFRIGLGDGRYLHNDYDYSQGYFWGDYQSQVGTYYEKVWALYYLAEAFDSFISNSKEDFVDSRYKNVSFATVYPRQTRRLYASLMTGDYEAFAPWVDVPASPDETPDGSLTYPTWHDPDSLGARPPSAFLVDPNYGWNNQLYAMVWGTMFFPTNWSLGFVDDARITSKPTDEVGWPPNEVIAFYDPKSGKTFRAHAVGTETQLGAVHQLGIGARMLEWANHLQTFAYLVQRDVGGVPVLGPDGRPIFILDLDGKPQLDPANPGADAVLQKYIDSIEIFRQLTATFEHPLDEGSLPQP